MIVDLCTCMRLGLPACVCILSKIGLYSREEGGGLLWPLCHGGSPHIIPPAKDPPLGYKGGGGVRGVAQPRGGGWYSFSTRV